MMRLPLFAVNSDPALVMRYKIFLNELIVHVFKSFKSFVDGF